MSIGKIIISNLLLFTLIFGMSATVDVSNLRRQLTNWDALLTGAFLQFIILPLLGFIVVKSLDMSTPMGVTLLVLTSSPGGSYSNWWCSMFNADLALSVTMTAISTLLSILMLPLNLYIYTTFSYDSSVVRNLDWGSMFASLVVVIGAISGGLICSARLKSYTFNRRANAVGNISGVALILFSLLVSSTTSSSTTTPSSDSENELSNRTLTFYLGVASPCILGLLIANTLTSCFQLKKAERVAVSVECCYQNVGIATSVAISMFDGDALGEAIGVPLYYGLVEAVVLSLYCIGAWKLGWTKAPRNEWFWVVLARSYEVDEMEKVEPSEAIEIVLGGGGGGGDKGGGTDMIFSMDGNRRHIVDAVTLDALTDEGGGGGDGGEGRGSERLGMIEEEDRVDRNNESSGGERQEQLRVPPTNSFPKKLPQPEIV